MVFQSGLGPVHAFEWLTTTRRWQIYAWRSAFVGLLLLGLGLVWKTHTSRTDLATLKGQAEIGRSFYQTLVFIELAMVLLAAPAATAGAICLDKARGTLFHVLVTDLTDAEIVLGKLAARLVPVLGMVLSSLPVMALATLMGGIDPVALTGSLLVILGLAVLGCTLALTLSVWGKKTHEVLLAMYLVWVVWLLFLPTWGLVSWQQFSTAPPDWVFKTNPYMLTVSAHNPSYPPSPRLGDQMLFLVAAIAISAALVALTVARLRPVIVGQWGRAERARKASTTGRIPAWWTQIGARWGWLDPSLDGNPVLWREWHRQRPSRWTRIVWALYLALAVGFSAFAIYMVWDKAPGAREIPIVVIVIQVAIGLLLISITAGTSLADERARGSLDVLIVTPLPTSAIVWGKWWGAFRKVPLLAILPALLACTLAYDTDRWVGPLLLLGLILAYGAALTSLGLALATWIPKVGRVLALCVTAYVGVTIGWVVVIVLLFPDGPQQYGNFPLYLVMGSPPYGTGVLSAAIEETNQPRIWPGSALAAIFWTAVYASAAGLLQILTLLTFDHCMGRIPDRSDRLPLKPVPTLSERKAARLVLDEV